MSIASRGRAAHRLDAQTERILRLWTDRVRAEISAAREESQPILIDTLPTFLSNLIDALSPDHPRQSAAEGSTVPSQHGSERVRLTGYRLADLIREYQLLRDVLFEVLDDGSLTDDERRVITISIDTAISQACTAYSLANDALREQMMATLAHDLRSPLGAAKAAAALILRRPDDPGVMRWAARVDENVDRADKLLRMLLDVSRAGSGSRMPLDLGPCDLVVVIRSVVETLELSHGDRFSVQAPLAVRGHWSADALGRALENLLSNALKYGAADKRVTITIQQTLGRAIVSVHNEGSFIPAGDRAMLFQPFGRSRGADDSGVAGWGLGLAFVRAVAEAHGGSVTIDSLPETGTTFTLDIPLDARPLQTAPTTPREA
ncbi:MAG TPA: sensor histidine kinase [Anaeromyxobacteraceae bacterium]|nr:sensor histidine kinase [Anaeromyxobacteraceae bacterium]